MSASHPVSFPSGGLPRHFQTTRWSIVLAACHGCMPEGREALATLCHLYWYPCYAYVRRRGHAAEPARDLTQGFFTRLLEKNDLASVEREDGRFRAWLLTALKHFLANAWHPEQARRRGGGQVLLSIDTTEAEGRYGQEPADEQTPERTFERRWALALLERALATLRGEWVRRGKGPLFEKLQGTLTGDMGEATYQAIAREVGMAEGAVKVTVHRLRRRYRELLQQEISHTVEHPDAVDDELRHLFAALS